MSSISIGRYFENIAALYLQRNRYLVLDHNYYSRYGELDLIAILENEYVFIEVKSIEESSDYSIYQALTKEKLRRVNRSAQIWLRENNLQNKVYRIEFIGIINNPSKCYLEHFKYIEI